MNRASDAFRARFVRVSVLALLALAVVAIVGSLATRDHVSLGASAAGLVFHSITYALTYRGRGLAGRRSFVYGILTLTTVSALFTPALRSESSALALLVALLVVLAGFLLTRAELFFACFAGLFVLLSVMVRGVLSGDSLPAVLPARAATLMAYGAVVVAVVLSTSHNRATQQRLAEELEDIDRVMVHASRIAKGDLTGDVEGDSEVSRTVRAMLEGLRGMVARMRETASSLASAARELSATAQQQEQGAVEQATAVRQVHATLARLLEQSGQAAHGTDDVFASVERTQRTTETVAQRAATLSAHTRGISSLLESIKNIANKSEILALNAALEGARAGEAGRGFSLVASQMQRLSESVMGSVRDVRALVDDIATATSATLAATEESTALSAEATAAAGRISVALQQHRAGSELVAVAMKDIEGVTAHVSAGSTQALAATRDLARLAEELSHALERFRV